MRNDVRKGIIKAINDANAQLCSEISAKGYSYFKQFKKDVLLRGACPEVRDYIVEYLKTLPEQYSSLNAENFLTAKDETLEALTISAMKNKGYGEEFITPWMKQWHQE